MNAELEQATKTLGNIATLSVGALDPELSREQIVKTLKHIYGLAVSLQADDDELDDQ
jgi:hypothetical protein